MLRITQIKLSITNSSISAYEVPRLFRLKVGRTVRTISKPAIILSESSMLWESSLSLPHQLQVQGTIEFINQQTSLVEYTGMITLHQPQQSLNASQIVRDSTNRRSWDIVNMEGQVIGLLSAIISTSITDITKSLVSSGHKLTITSQTAGKDAEKVLRVLSIVAKLSVNSSTEASINTILKKGYICIEVGEQVIRTPEIRSKSGQLIFMEPRQIQLTAQDNSALIKVYAVPQQKEKDSLQPYPVAQTVLQLKNMKPTTKLVLSSKGFEVGQIYLQCRIITKNQVPTSNFVQNANKREIVIVNQLEHELESGLVRRSIMPSTNSKYFTLDYSSLESMNSGRSRVSKRSKLDSSQVSTNSKRNSVLNQNSNIVFPRSLRFKLHQDTQNQNVTYLDPERHSFQFKREGRYRGASLGYGQKSDFIKKGVPGVGDYKLPSIWDRY